MENKEIITSIILPCYFRPKVLWWGLFSIVRQLPKMEYKFEIIVLNDGVETDDTEKICKSFINRYNLNIRYIFVGQRNTPTPIWRVPGAVINIGARLAKGDILILSSPEIFHINKNSINVLTKPLLTNSKLLTIPNGKDDLAGKFLNHLEQRKNKLDTIDYNIYFSINKTLNTKLPFCMGLTKEQFNKIGGYNKDFFEGFCFDDNDFVDRLLQDGCSYEHVQNKIIHLFNTRKAQNRIGLTDRNKMWQKNKDLYDIAVQERKEGKKLKIPMQTKHTAYNKFEMKKLESKFPMIKSINLGIEFDIELKPKIEKKAYKPIFHYCVMTTNRGDIAIRESIKRSIQKYLPEVPFAYFNCKGENLTEDRIKQFNNEASLLIIGGSGLYTNYSTASGWYFPCQTELFSKLKIPIVLMGIGKNNNLKKDIFKGKLKLKTQKSIKLINELSVISTVRDERTFNMLSSLGIKKHELLLDPANFLNYSIETKKEKRIAINIAQHSPLLGRFDGNNKIRNKNIKYFTKISNYLIEKGYSVIFIAHDALEQSLIIDLKKRVPELEYLNTDDIDSILREYSRCQFSIGVKMHSNIMSFAVGTPFISIYYDKKSIEYLKLLNYSDFGVSIFDNYYNNLKDNVNKLINQWQEYSNYFKRIKQKEFEKYDEVIKKICNIVKERNENTLAL